MSTTVKNKGAAFLHGQDKFNESAYGLAHKKVVVVEVDDMSAVANNDVVYTFPDDAVLQTVAVKNYGTTAFSVATTLTIDDGTTAQTGALKTLAAEATEFTNVTPAKKVAGSQLLWNVVGANSSASTAKARVIIEYTTFDDVSV